MRVKLLEDWGACWYIDEEDNRLYLEGNASEIAVEHNCPGEPICGEEFVKSLIALLGAPERDDFITVRGWRLVTAPSSFFKPKYVVNK